jgi:hypothetical protein
MINLSHKIKNSLIIYFLNSKTVDNKVFISFSISIFYPKNRTIYAVYYFYTFLL